LSFLASSFWVKINPSCLLCSVTPHTPLIFLGLQLLPCLCSQLLFRCLRPSPCPFHFHSLPLLFHDATQHRNPCLPLRPAYTSFLSSTSLFLNAQTGHIAPSFLSF
jgi:hypothetical protein